MDNELTILEIDKSLIPYRCDMILGGELFTLHFSYNASAEVFTVDLYRDGELVCAGEPIMYGVPLWADVHVDGKFPDVAIIPLDLSGESHTVTYDNLGDAVQLIVTDREVTDDG